MKKIRDLLPSYSVLPLFLMLLVNFFAYYVSKILISGREKYDFGIFIDDRIPLIAPFIVIYLLAYVQWVIGYIVVVRENERTCSRAASANIIAKTLCFLIFVIVPTEIERQAVSGTDIFSNLVKFIYFMDTPINLFPSIHCMESYAIIRFTLPLKTVGKTYKAVMCVFSVLVFLSVLFTRQHFIVDIPAGILALEIGILISRITKADTVFIKKQHK